MAQQPWKNDDFKNWERFYRASFFNSLAGFKSANLIGTVSSSGKPNLTIFFSVIHVGANPPHLGLLMRPPTVARHTLENMRETREFTVNAVGASFLQAAHQTSAHYGEEVSEFEKVGLSPLYFPDFKAPAVRESEIRSACRLVEEHEIKANGTLFLVGRIDQVWIDDRWVEADGSIAHHKAETVALRDLEHYHSTREIAHLGYARPDQDGSNN